MNQQNPVFFFFFFSFQLQNGGAPLTGGSCLSGSIPTDLTTRPPPDDGDGGGGDLLRGEYLLCQRRDRPPPLPVTALPDPRSGDSSRWRGVSGSLYPTLVSISRLGRVLARSVSG
jgi:hypothetical protein